MSHSFLSVHHLSFAYEVSNQIIIDDFSAQFETGWTGIVGANGCGKSTLLKLLTRQLLPDSGSIKMPSASVYCEQRTDSLPDDTKDFLLNYSPFAIRLKSQLNIEDDWFNRWDSLSHGERKRIQIACALGQEPDVLALDEPSNHMDVKSKRILLHALKSFQGVGLLVSHDRDLLDQLCAHTLFMDPPNLIFRKGNYSTTYDDLEKENQYKSDLLKESKRKIKSLKREVHRRKKNAARADARRSKKNIHRKDHDAKARMDLARLTGKDAVEGQIFKRLSGQLERMQQEQESIDYQKKAISGIQIHEDKQKRGYLFHLQSMCLSMGKSQLQFPDLFLTQGERLGLIGPNGAGKSTLIRHIVQKLIHFKDDILYIPQEISIEQSKEVIDQIHSLKSDEKGKMMTIISRLGSDPVRLLETELPSPGEMRKLFLAEGIRKNVQLIIMDEPTNHMDLPSIQCIEEALDACQCAMILVSHDQAFLDQLVTDYWEIIDVGKPDFKLVVRNE